MSSKRPFYVTTPIYYVNDLPHIGHTYTTVVADVLARYRKMRGADVRFITGTDEHGINIQRAAERQGLRPIELADRVVARYHTLWGDGKLGITHDDFIRTTEPRHREAVHKLWLKVREAGDIYLGTYAGWYCAPCEAYYPEGQLVEGRCPTHARPAEWVEEPSYFFRLSKYQEPLLRLYEAIPGIVRPESRRNEIVSFVASGLKDLSISRGTLKWGVPVPGDPSHVVYVWFDALTNYISALGYGSRDESLYRRYWATGDRIAGRAVAPVLHLVGKDILRFHAVYWPAFLLSAGEPVPGCVFAHGWWLNDERKMSKTLGNVVRPDPLLKVFGPDGLRHFLLREMTFGLDGSFSYDAVIERLNADLANNLGNLLSRVTSLLRAAPWEGRLPPAEGTPPPEDCLRLRGILREAHAAWLEAFDGLAFSEGLGAVWGALDEVNRFLVVHQPWKARADASRLHAASVLRSAAEALYMAGVWTAPVSPGIAREIWRQLGVPRDPGDLRDLAPGAPAPESLPAGRVGEPRSLFGRLDRARTLGEIETLTSAGSAPASSARAAEGEAGGPEAGKTERKTVETITIDQFKKVDLRVARVESAERVAGADKLLKLVVDLGGERRQIVAGIAQVYPPEDLVGKLIVVVANLEPAVVRGVESQGMLLAADAGGKPFVATFEAPVPPGSRVR